MFGKNQYLSHAVAKKKSSKMVYLLHVSDFSSYGLYVDAYIIHTITVSYFTNIVLSPESLHLDTL